MTSQRGSSSSQLFEAGYQQLFEGWKQAQEFWNNMARSWGGATGAWMQQTAGADESMDVLRELNESAFAVAQAWLRMPFVMMGGAGPSELQEAVTRLTQAQGRAYQLWLEALSRSGATAADATQQAAKEKK
jgi:hypothetical protein